MTTFLVDTLPAEVVIPGCARMVENTYIGDAATTFKPGDLVRITTGGEIKDAGVDTDQAGPIHGMILTNDYSAVAAAATQFVPILKFCSDTILKVQLYAAAAADAQPQDVAVGTKLTLRNGAAGIWCATVTTTKGIATVEQKPGNVKWFDSDYDLDKNYGFIYVRFAEALLDAFGS